MARSPLTGLLPQYAKNAGGAAASGYWLKLYSVGSTSAKSMYTALTGGSTLAKCTLNSRGETISNQFDDDSTFIPYVDGDYDAYLFETAADADSNNTAASVYLGRYEVAGEQLSDVAILQFATVVTLISGNALNYSDSIDWSDYLGRDVTTVVHNATSNDGGATYEVTTTNPGSLSTLVSGVWTGKNQDLGGGYYAKLKSTAPYDPLEFGAIPSAIGDSTEAFNLAMAEGATEFTGTFEVNDITAFSAMELRGTSKAYSVLETGTPNGSIFLHNSASDVTRVRLRNFTARPKNSATGTRFWKQVDKSVYTSFPIFEDIETDFGFEVSYDGYFIFSNWDGIRDGFVGSAIGSQTHQTISSNPAAYGQSKQTNLNEVRNSSIFRSDHPDGAVDISYGLNWSFKNTDFEQLGTRPIRARGIFNLIVDDNCWFEECDADELVLADVSPSPNPQSTRPFVFSNNQAFMHANNIRAVTVNSASQVSIFDNAWVSIPAGCVLSNRTTLIEYYGNQAISGAGATTFLDGMVAARNSMQISSSEMTSNVINSPQSQNQNVLPIGPSGLNSTNFTAVTYTGLTDVASQIGLAGNAVQFTIAGSAGCLTYEMPAKLRDFLEGRTVTIVVAGWGDATGGQTSVQAAAWENVVPNGTNQSIAGGIIDSSKETLTISYATFTIGSGLTSLHFGVRSGGIAGTPDVKIESMAVVLGEVKPDALTLV